MKRKNEPRSMLHAQTGKTSSLEKRLFRQSRPVLLRIARYHWCMVMDTRDYYIKRLRQKLGYVERAAFRVPVHGPAKFRLNIVWRVLLWFVVLVILARIAKSLF